MTVSLSRSALPAALVLLAACGEPVPSDTDLGGRVSVITPEALVVLAQEAYSGYRSSARLVVSDAPAWAAAWQQVYATAQPQPSLPAVDFSSDVVLVAAAGAHASGGSDIRIDSVVTLASGTVVHVTTSTPGPGCFTTAAFTQPVLVARVPAPQAPVRFAERAVVEDCD